MSLLENFPPLDSLAFATINGRGTGPARPTQPSTPGSIGEPLLDRKPPRTRRRTPPRLRPDRMAWAAGRTLHSSAIGVLPVLDRFFERLRLRSILQDHLPREDRRCRIATATGLLLLLKNLLVSRVPLYGIGQWAARHVP
jgi:Domain of unknown function (DUF4277)